MKNITNARELIEALYDNWDMKFKTLDFEAKIDDKAEQIKPYVNENVDLSEVYYKLCRTSASMPAIPRVINALQTTERKNETEQIINNGDNGKMLLFICYKDGYCREIREYIVKNDNTKTRTSTEVIKDLRKRFDNVQVREFPSGATLVQDVVFDKENGKICKAEVVENGEVDSDGEVISLIRTEVA